MALGPYIL